jgi:hypothetical protein
MNNQVPKYVTQERAALLLGIPEKELSRIFSELELGHTERAGIRKDVFHVRRVKADLPSLDAPINTWQILSRRNICRTNRASRSVFLGWSNTFLNVPRAMTRKQYSRILIALIGVAGLGMAAKGQVSLASTSGQAATIR